MRIIDNDKMILTMIMIIRFHMLTGENNDDEDNR